MLVYGTVTIRVRIQLDGDESAVVVKDAEGLKRIAERYGVHAMVNLETTVTGDGYMHEALGKAKGDMDAFVAEVHAFVRGNDNAD